MDLEYKTFTVVYFYSLDFLLQTLMIHSIAGEGKEPSWLLPTISTRLRMFRKTFVVFHMRWLLSIITPAHVITRLLHNEIYQPLEINNLISLVDIMSGIIRTISQRQVVNLKSRQLSSHNYKRND